jgi:flagellar basal-body rod modification protein FlgD
MTIRPLTATSETAETTTQAAKSPVNKETFLQLLVAQIKNQNPLNPADGVQFLTQLAQFSELEQMMGIRDEIAGLRTDIAETDKTADSTATTDTVSDAIKETGKTSEGE